MHGCSGLLDAKGRIFPLYRLWARSLVVQGYVALVVDSATPRGFGQTCSAGPQRATMLRDRPSDAYAACCNICKRNRSCRPTASG